MSSIGVDDGNRVVQAAYLGQTGSTTTITTAAAASAKTAAALNGGLYRVVSTVDVRIASGVFATVTAAATDTPIAAYQEEYFMIRGGDTIAAYDAGAGGGTVSISEMGNE